MKKTTFSLILALIAFLSAGVKWVSAAKNKQDLKAEMNKLSTGKEIRVADKDSICN